MNGCLFSQEIFEAMDEELEGAQWSRSVVQKIVNTVTVFGDKLTGGVKEAVGKLASGIQFIKDLANGIWSKMEDAFNRIKGLNPSSLWNGISSRASDLWSGLAAAAKEEVTGVLEVLYKEFNVGIFVDVLSRAWSNVNKYFQVKERHSHFLLPPP